MVGQRSYMNNPDISLSVWGFNMGRNTIQQENIRLLINGTGINVSLLEENKIRDLLAVIQT